MITCKNCGAVLSDDSRFCGKCGIAIQTAKNSICPNCRSEVAPDLIFCDKCGTKLSLPATDSYSSAGLSKKLTITRERQFQCAANTYQVIVNGKAYGTISIGRTISADIDTDIVTLEIISTTIMIKSKLRLVLRPGKNPKVTFKIQWPGDIIASVLDADILEQQRNY